MKKALLFEKDNGTVKCLLCAHHCRLKEGQTGICRVRRNESGELYSLNYNRVAATQADPIEKKPLYHFLPASTSFSVAAMGCNFKCSFCQNNSLSVVQDEAAIYGQAISPAELVKTALKYGSRSISYTYSEPTIYFELMLETAKLAAAEGLKNVMVANGYMSAEALDLMGPYLHAANVDVKAFSESFYKKYCGASLQPVLDTVKRMRERGIWVEVTTLMIPDLNSDMDEIEGLIAFISSVDKNMPWHVSRFFPQHRLQDVLPTSTKMIYNALDKAKEMGLKYLYAGNVPDDKYSNTHCPSCGELLIKRSGYSTVIKNLKNGSCLSCNQSIPGVWS
ncbi:MAG: AmmeMemoRadiSam system radical SAM enzyme [bacterium]|nr:AmmeMemoRadiSam system radical SAM enzyme [bacterium]